MNYPRAELALDRCVEWLQEEEAYRFRKYGPPSDAALHTLVDREVPNHWRQFQLFRNNRVHQQATQAVLKFCAATRAAAMVGSMHRGADYEFARWSTLNQLNETKPVVAARVPRYASCLSMPFIQIIGGEGYGPQNVQVTYMHAAGLAVAHLVERVAQEGRIALPAPGYPSGEIVPWNKGL